MASDETNKLIDAEIRLLVDTAHQRATDILKGNEDKLHLLAKAMLDLETVTGDEINELIREHNEWYPVEAGLPLDPQTRDYVRIIQRNEEIYRALYEIFPTTSAENPPASEGASM